MRAIQIQRDIRDATDVAPIEMPPLVFAARRGADATQPIGRCGLQIRSGAAPYEIAVGKAESRDRAAEAHLAGPVEIEAGLERQAADRRAVAVAARSQRAGRQHHIAARSLAAGLDVAGDRTVRVDAAVAVGAVETVVGEVLAGD